MSEPLGLLFGSGTAASYYVEALWFGSLGYAEVFWRTVNIQATLFAVFSGATFAVLYGAFLALQPPHFGELGSGGVIFINGRPVRVPVGPVLRAAAIVVALVIALITGAGMMSEWPTFAPWWYAGGPPLAAAPQVDPIFGRPIPFYLFTLPAWQLASVESAPLVEMVFRSGR